MSELCVKCGHFEAAHAKVGGCIAVASDPHSETAYCHCPAFVSEDDAAFMRSRIPGFHRMRDALRARASRLRRRG